MHSPTRLIHLDLDGVLADFRKGFVAKTGLVPEECSTDEMWSRIAAVQKFFLQLDVTADGLRLFAFAQMLGEVRILTATPRRTTHPTAEVEKRQWAAIHFGDVPVTVVQYARQKADQARPGDILIDDSPENIRRWNAAGGLGIVHTGFDNTVEEANRLLADIGEKS
jgi:hypothetical protein